MKFIDKRKEDETLTKFSDVLVGDIFELPDDDAVYMKVNLYDSFHTNVLCGRVDAVPLVCAKDRPREKYIQLDCWVRVRVLDAELIINKNIVR